MATERYPLQPGEVPQQEHTPSAPQETGPTQTPETQYEAEVTREQPRETQEQRVDDAISGMRKKLRVPKKKKGTVIPVVRDELTNQIENIMEAGLEEAFKELSPIEQQEFKIKGEQTAIEIRTLMKSTRVKVKKVFRLLFEWLKMLPGINRFFLEQEAKIKTDKILSLKQHDQS